MKNGTKHQTGSVIRCGKSWLGRWWRDELETLADGSKQIVRRQHAEKLCEVSDRYRSPKDVRPLLAEKLAAVNAGRSTAESTMPVADYANKYFLPDVQAKLKPSTAHGYAGLLRMYLAPRLTGISLRDFRCVDACRLLAAIHRDHNLSRKSLRHCKGLLSVIFAHAKRAGILDGINPVEGSEIPHSAKGPEDSHAYTPQEVHTLLDVLEGPARTAVALMFFAGLRPGEARAARWENYDGKTLRVTESMWRTITGTPKTAESVAPVPVCSTLAEILAESRRESGLILGSPQGKAFDPHNVARRAVVPVLARCVKCRKPEHAANGHAYQPVMEWRGWYALRRGCATMAASLDSALAAKSLLRHSNIATTQKHYVKSVEADGLRAAEKMNALFEKSTTAVQ